MCDIFPSRNFNAGLADLQLNLRHGKGFQDVIIYPCPKFDYDLFNLYL